MKKRSKREDEGRLVRMAKAQMRAYKKHGLPPPDPLHPLRDLCDRIAWKREEGVSASQVAEEEGLTVQAVFDLRLVVRKLEGASDEEVAHSEGVAAQTVRGTVAEYETKIRKEGGVQ